MALFSIMRSFNNQIFSYNNQRLGGLCFTPLSSLQNQASAYNFFPAVFYTVRIHIFFLSRDFCFMRRNFLAATGGLHDNSLHLTATLPEQE